MKSSRILTLFSHMQTTFNAPEGNDPLALDMGSMGKGIMWINGQSIGRHWPANLAKGKCSQCHYAGQYSETKCLSDCDNPSQRWLDQCSLLPPFPLVQLIWIVSYIWTIHVLVDLRYLLNVSTFQVPCSTVMAETNWQFTGCVRGVGWWPEGNFFG